LWCGAGLPTPEKYAPGEQGHLPSCEPAENNNGLGIRTNPRPLLWGRPGVVSQLCGHCCRRRGGLMSRCRRKISAG
jgi:hypothetical protein